MQEKRHIIRNLTRLFWLVTIVLSLAVYSSGAAESVSVESSVVGQACKLIYEGQFDAADELIKQSRNDVPAQLGKAIPRLSQLVDQYKSISQERQLAREAAYAEVLTELEKFQAPAEVNDVNDANAADTALHELLNLQTKHKKSSSCPIRS